MALSVKRKAIWSYLLLLLSNLSQSYRLMMSRTWDLNSKGRMHLLRTDETSKHSEWCSRRAWLGGVATSIVMSQLLGLTPASAAEDKLLARLQSGLDGLDYLIENWEEETTECIYADVPRELLETKNKEALLKAATKFALYDKSDSTVSCKRTAKPIRKYLGLTSSDTPLYKIDFLLQKASSRVDPDMLDDYISATEVWSQLISSADSQAYVSSKGDYASFGEVKKGDDDEGSYLGQARKDIIQARAVLKTLIDALS